jgi:ubiquinone/menaquinone biosynthesis C-methylase UbiE
VTLDAANAEQSDYWNGEAGRRWTALQDSQDRLFTPITAALFEAAAPKRGEGVIDIGCGAGATTLAAAESTGRALGADLSAPMLARARERAAQTGSPARFVQADATTYDFAAEEADLLISRFGVMFFADPAKAFANLRRGVRRGARLVFACWQEPKLNPHLMLAYKAATKHAPPLPKLGPEDPGPFSFADEARVKRVLGEAGFSEVTLTPHAFTLDAGVGEGVDNAVAKSLEIGPASRALAGQPEEVRAAAVAEIRAAFAAVAQGDQVPLGAAVWIVGASA